MKSIPRTSALTGLCALLALPACHNLQTSPSYAPHGGGYQDPYNPGYGQGQQSGQSYGGNSYGSGSHQGYGQQGGGGYYGSGQAPQGGGYGQGGSGYAYGHSQDGAQVSEVTGHDSYNPPAQGGVGTSAPVGSQPRPSRTHVVGSGDTSGG